ncbi:hypothetical protein JYU34_020896 [Plutella xylostella]|uniref:Regulatory protein zeste n=1 Tax=Plutella xylostella TaxID=51655 RepID=A0ABQ7PS59_PLUXY|nr:hypothetical protein JYU34_020896 [Plutella xylostella]
MSQRPEKEKRQYPTAAQKIRLAQLLEADEELRSGKFTATFTKKMSSERWDRIAQQLNSHNGASKTGKEWRTTWGDMKSYVKKKYAGQRRSMLRTSRGGPAIQSESADKTAQSDLSGHDTIARLLALKSGPAAMALDDDMELVPNVDIEIVEDDPLYLTETKPTATDPSDTDEPAIEPKIEQPNPQPIPSENEQSSGIPRPRRTVAQRRFQNYFTAAQQPMHLQIKQKIRMKKDFNQAYLYEMRRRTDAILELSNSIRSLSSMFANLEENR